MFDCPRPVGGGNSVIAQTWEDYTSKIVNPSFESDEASSNLKTGTPWGTGTGWTITPSSQPANSQSGIANASTTIQGIANSFSPADGDKYMYIGCNWQASTEFKVTQTLPASSGFPKGTYRLSCSVANFSSNYYSSTYRLSLSDGTNTASNTFFYSKKAWNTMSIVFFKPDDATDLTMEAYMKPGESGDTQHYCLLVDNFKLEYLSDTELWNASESNPYDFTAAISNANIYNENKESCPKGWSCPAHTAGNSKYTENTGDTQLEGWHGSSSTMNVHYTQTLSNLPNGKYIVKANVHDSNDTGAVLYASSGSNTVTGDMAKDYAVVPTDVISVTDKTLTIGIKGENIGGTWMTGDDFQVFYVGIDLSALQTAYSTLQSEAEALLTNAAYENVKGSERTALKAAKGVTPEEKKTALVTAISNLQAAMNTFKAAKTSYDEFVAERTYATEKFEVTDVALPTSADDAVRLTNTLNVAEYNYVKDKYTVAIKVGSEWTTNNISSNKGQHWSGNSTTTYDDKWSSSAWTGSKTLQLTLPAGSYILKASGRKVPNAQLALKVSVEDSELGSVSNFPNTNVGKGIATDGSANFSDDAAYANGNNGYGWQWRFVPFTIDADDTAVKISVEASGDGGAWISICDYELFAIPNVATATMEYEQVLTEAQNTPDSYPTVTGEELTDLNAKISADKGETVESITAATASLRNAMATLIDANSAYVSFNDAKSLTVIETLPYASSDKYTAMVTAANVESASSKADAEAKTADILRTRRAYVESNGKAEGVEGAVDCTASVVNADFSDELNGWDSSQGGGTLGAPDGQTWTNADGSAGGHYYDYWNGTANNQHGSQTVTGLKPGKYIVTLKARAQSDFNLYLMINGNKVVDINEIGNTGGVFGNGWNDYTAEFIVDKAGSVKIEVANTPSSNQAGWFGFGDVRLVRLALTLDESTDNTITNGLANVILKRNIVADVWNTLVLPFNMTNDEVVSVFGEGAQVAKFSNTEDENVNFDTTTEGITANVPVLLKAAAGTEYAFNGYTLVEGTPKVEGTQYDFVGNYNAKYNLADGEYMLSGSKFWKNDGAKNYHVKGFRAYLSPKTPEAAAKSLNLVIDGTTTGLKLNTVTGEVEGESYNLAGQRVADSYKGLVIKNGKKVIRR